ncbi:hypothetical protein CRUP_012068 [Coryphaenoides rupestris]|nr:hypothetical protein CRUP_012068 [Coryphaenoides rupestris]
MEKAHVHLAGLQSSLSMGHLPRLFSAAMTCLLSPHTPVVSAATNTLKTLLTECVGPRMEEIGTVTPTASSGNPSYVCKMFRIVEEGLSYRFHASWPFVLQALGCFYRVAGKRAHPVMVKGRPWESHGPRGPAFRWVVPGCRLNITATTTTWTDPAEPGCDPSLPRPNKKHPAGPFFTSYFMPAGPPTLHQRRYAGGIWTMLPGFCTGAVDLLASFKGLARALGMTINERADLRLTRRRVPKVRPCFAKNFLPILFNVYSQRPADGQPTSPRMAVLDTIKVYLTVTDLQMICTFLQKAARRGTRQQGNEAVG